MIRESLILTSVTASLDLEDAIPRPRRRQTASECERVVSFFENLADMSDGTVTVAGRDCSMTCILAASLKASGRAVDPRLGCSGRIVLLGAESGGQTGVAFKVRRGRRGKPASLTLTFNPSRLLTGADAQPTLISKQSQKAVATPSTFPWVMFKLCEFPFELLEAIKHAISGAKLFEGKVEAERIRIHRMEWSASLPCSDANGLLQVLAIAMEQPVSDGRVVWPLARHLGLAVKPEVDSDRDRMRSVSLEKRQGRRKLFCDPLLGRQRGRLAQERCPGAGRGINLDPPDHRRPFRRACVDRSGGAASGRRVDRTAMRNSANTAAASMTPSRTRRRS